MKKEIEKILKNNNQEHILDFLPLLNDTETKKLEEQIENIDFNEMLELFKETKKNTDIQENKIEHIAYTDKNKLNNVEKEELDNIGTDIISAGKYALVTMAGGQGTRLGHKGPKGSYELNTIKGKKFLFEIIIDGLKRANEKYKVVIPWYIMTSRENNNQTIEFLKEHNYFGYDSSKIKFFKQGELPLIDTNGKLILDKDKRIKEASNGNGGVYQALRKTGMLEDMKKNNVEWIFINGIDNILSNFVDPTLLGLAIKQNNLVAAKSVVKNYPKEKAGVFCRMNGKPKVIEYIDLPDEMAEQVDENGELLYGEMNIVSQLFNIKALEELSNIRLPYHPAFKKSGYLDTDGEFIEVETPNVFKFEAFIFDAYSNYDAITILRVKRNEEFAPIKNKEGVDSPETATKLYNEFYK